MKISKVILFCVFVVAIINLSCKKQSKNHSISISSKWNGIQIIFPHKSVFTKQMKETSDFHLFASHMKIMVYEDTSGCLGCKTQLNKWKEFLLDIHSMSTESIPCAFFFFPKDTAELKFLLENQNFDYPICVDLKDSLNKLNHFSSDVTFLLDKNNKVLLAGNPVTDIDTKRLYIEKITGRKIVVNDRNTSASIERSLIDIGTFDKSKTKYVDVKVKNTGNSPLIITDINTSCGCVTASFEKRPVLPGKSCYIRIKVQANDQGFLKKRITVIGNIDSALKITIQGNAI